MSGKKKLRSAAWFARQDKMGFYYRSWLKNRGFPQDQFDGRPVIGICNTWSELTPCNSHFRTVAEHVRWGVLEAGGFPLEFPVMSLGEVMMRPTAMLYRNLASMDVEESVRANPLDGVVLLMGCDKTTPSLLMGAASVDLPTIGISGGPMLRGIHCGKPIGSGTNVISMSEQLRSGQITLAEFHQAEADMHRSHGHCMTMGTASTMACMVEALGVGMPGNAAIPAVDARRNLLAREAGRRIVELVRTDVLLSKILTRNAFENAIRVNAGIGGRGGREPARLEGAPVIAHEQVLHRMSGLKGEAPRMPFGVWPHDTFFTNRKQIYFADEVVEMLHMPAAHTDGDLIVWFRKSDVVSTGDVFSTVTYPMIDLTRGGSVQGILNALNSILDITFPEFNNQGGTLVVPGHGRICNESDVAEYRDMTTIIRDRIQSMIDKRMTLAQVKAAGPSKDYDGVYSTPAWTGEMFVEAIYTDLTRARRR